MKIGEVAAFYEKSIMWKVEAYNRKFIAISPRMRLFVFFKQKIQDYIDLYETMEHFGFELCDTGDGWNRIALVFRERGAKK